MDKIKTLNQYKIFYILMLVFVCLVLFLQQLIVKFTIRERQYKRPLIESSINHSSTVTVYLGEGFIEQGFYVFENGIRVLDVLAKVENSIVLEDSFNSSRVLQEGDVLSFSRSTSGLNKKSISQADYATLLKIPGIGDSKANKILEYISKNSPSSVSDLLNVPGIGDKTINDIKEFYY